LIQLKDADPESVFCPGMRMFPSPDSAALTFRMLSGVPGSIRFLFRVVFWSGQPDSNQAQFLDVIEPGSHNRLRRPPKNSAKIALHASATIAAHRRFHFWATLSK
jgi:hypothetical protein